MLSLVVVVALLAIIYRLVNRAPSSELAPNEQIVEVMTDGGCLFCHSANPKLPFFANYPIARNLIGKHVENGYAAFDMQPFMTAMREGTAPDEVSLAKIE